MSKANVYVDIEKCKGCRFCIDVCPQKIIQLSHSTNLKSYQYAVILDMEKCTGCKFCLIICPEIAIEIDLPKKNRSKKSNA